MAKKKGKTVQVVTKSADYARFYLRVTESASAPARLPELMVRQVLDRGQ